MVAEITAHGHGDIAFLGVIGTRLKGVYHIEDGEITEVAVVAWAGRGLVGGFHAFG